MIPPVVPVSFNLLLSLRLDIYEAVRVAKKTLVMCSNGLSFSCDIPSQHLIIIQNYRCAFRIRSGAVISRIVCFKGTPKSAIA